jgi:hypothetical protein
MRPQQALGDARFLRARFLHPLPIVQESGLRRRALATRRARL